MHGENSTPSSSLNDSTVTVISQSVTSTPSAPQRQSINTPTATLGTSSCTTPAPRGTSQTDSMPHVVSSPASGIASTPTPLRGLENLPTPDSDPEAHAIISNPLLTRATNRDQRQRWRQLQLQVVSTSRSMVSGSRSIDQFGQSDMIGYAFATGRLM